MAGHIMVCRPGSGANSSKELSALTSLDLFFGTMTDFVSRYSLMPAITVYSIIYSHIKTGGYNGNDFIQFIEGLLTVMNPYPGPCSVLIIDIC